MKIKYIFILFICVNFFACNSSETKQDIKTDLNVKTNDFKKSETDSLIVIVDSTTALKGEIPKESSKIQFSAKCINSFNKLANSSGGYMKVLVNPTLLTKTINQIIDSNCTDNSDVLLLIDKTGSMSDDIENVKKGLNTVIKNLSKFEKVRFGIGTYGDKNTDGEEWYSFKNFESNYNLSIEYINKIETTGGGDYPESVYDGIYKISKENFWKSNNKRILILIGDAPSLEKPESDHSIDEILDLAKSEKINMNLYPIVLSPNQSYTYVADPIKYNKVNLIKSLEPNPSNGELNLIVKNIKGLEFQVWSSDSISIMKTFSKDENLIFAFNDFKNGTYTFRVIDSMNNYDEKKFTIKK